MKGKLYGIGTGPGDPDLITLKAVKILQKVDVVVIPGSGNDKESLAFEIAREHVRGDAAIITQTFPMIRDEHEKAAIRKRHAGQIAQLVQEGRQVAFLTLGDPLLYSTYIYILDNLAGNGIDIETVPGITAFSAIAGKYAVPLAQQDEGLAVVPLHGSLDIEKCIRENSTIVFMKVSAAKERLAEALKKHGDSLEWIMVSSCGREGEFMSTNVEDLYSDIPYMTTVIVKHKSTDSSKEIT